MMEVTSPLTFEISGEPFLLEKRIRLLNAIREHGSISKAAKAVPMSYKSAWEAVDAMNALSPEPIVYRETGGKDGGGTTVTEYGRQLLENYAILKEEHNRFMERLSALVDTQTGTFGTLGRLALQLSARNQIQATVGSIVCGSVSAELTLRLKGGQEIVSVITTEAVEDLQLKEGDRVVAVWKSSNVVLSKNASSSKDNRLKGSIVSVEDDGVHIKVLVDLGGHDRLVAVVPAASFDESIFSEGKAVTAVIAPRDILIGR